jgi:hypothetical protein
MGLALFIRILVTVILTAAKSLAGRSVIATLVVPVATGGGGGGGGLGGELEPPPQATSENAASAPAASMRIWVKGCFMNFFQM